MKKLLLLIAFILLLLALFFVFNNKENLFAEINPKPELKLETPNTNTDHKQNRLLAEHTKERTSSKKKSKEDNFKTPKIKLKVPDKWKDLDYSNYGNPPEVATSPKEYLAGDQLYEPDDPRYYHDGQVYFGADAEEKLMKFFLDRDRLSKLINDKHKAKDLFNGLFSDINNFIYIDKETGRKMLVPGVSDSRFEEVLGKVLGCAPIAENSIYQCAAWERLAKNYIRANNIDAEEEKEMVYELYKERSHYFDIGFGLDFKAYSYLHKNKSKEERDE